jgi:hypothetical protein
VKVTLDEAVAPVRIATNQTSLIVIGSAAFTGAEIVNARKRVAVIITISFVVFI